MFGHDDKDKDEKDQTELENNANGQENKDWQHPGTPLDDKKSDSTGSSSDSVVTPSEDSDSDKPEAEKADETAPNKEAPKDEPVESIGSAPAASGTANDLIDIKQEALSKLSPLVGHLDQSPEEKFKTLMMMIQASDDQKMVKQAYDVALEISDEKERAQALLDIVNEINYFTQNPAKSE